jgi:hypothetical protein
VASILDALTQTLTPDVVDQLGFAAGLDSSLVNKGIRVVGPLLTGAMADVAVTPGGLDRVARALPEAQGGAGLGNLLGMLASGGAPSDVMSGLFGSGLGAISSTLDKSLGFRASPLLALAAPFVLNLVGQRARAERLDASGVARMLREEQQAFTVRGGDAARLVQQALEAGSAANRIRARYTGDEWVRLRLAPYAATRVVMAASPSGLVGTRKEMSAGHAALGAARAAMGPTALGSLAFESAITEAELERLSDAPGASLSVIRETMSTIAARDPAEAAGYGKLLVDVAQAVAEAAKEGGFLGIGGSRVSAEEQSAIEQVRLAAGLAAFKAGA